MVIRPGWIGLSEESFEGSEGETGKSGWIRHGIIPHIVEIITQTLVLVGNQSIGTVCVTFSVIIKITRFTNIAFCRVFTRQAMQRATISIVCSNRAADIRVNAVKSSGVVAGLADRIALGTGRGRWFEVVSYVAFCAGEFILDAFFTGIIAYLTDTVIKLEVIVTGTHVITDSITCVIRGSALITVPGVLTGSANAGIWTAAVVGPEWECEVTLAVLSNAKTWDRLFVDYTTLTVVVSNHKLGKLHIIRTKSPREAVPRFMCLKRQCELRVCETIDFLIHQGSEGLGGGVVPGISVTALLTEQGKTLPGEIGLDSSPIFFAVTIDEKIDFEGGDVGLNSGLGSEK